MSSVGQEDSEKSALFGLKTVKGRLSQSPSHDFFRFWYARHFEARSYIWFISGVFALFNFLSCLHGLYIVLLPKIIASRPVASLK